MAKTDWKMGDIVRPEDLNQLGREINETSAAAATAQSIAENHASRHAAGGPDEITPAMIGAETPAGAQAKASAAEANAKAYTDTVAASLTSAINRAENHAARNDNPHSVTKGQVGLGNVQNYGVASQAQAEAGTDNASYMTPLRTKQYVDTRLQNNLRFRLINGLPEYYDGSGWKPVSGAVLVPSDTIQEEFLTQRTIIGTEVFMLVAKHIPKGTGEIRITGEILRPSISAAASINIVATSVRNFASTTTVGINAPIVVPADFLDWRTPVGTNLSLSSQYHYPLYHESYIDGSWNTFDVIILVTERVPFYLCFRGSDGGSVRNLRIRYDVK